MNKTKHRLMGSRRKNNQNFAKSKEQQSKYREYKLTRDVADGVHGGNVGHRVAHRRRLEHVRELKKERKKIEHQHNVN